MQDLVPYICTYEDCTLEDTFETSEQLGAHIERTHLPKYWICQLCSAKSPTGNRFRTQQSFKDHLAGVHQTLEDSQRSDLVHSSVRTAGQPFLVCHFCEEFEDEFQKLNEGETKRQDALRKHIAGHMQSIALISLPWDATADAASGETRVEQHESSSSDSSNRSSGRGTITRTEEATGTPDNDRVDDNDGLVDERWDPRAQNDLQIQCDLLKARQGCWYEAIAEAEYRNPEFMVRRTLDFIDREGFPPGRMTVNEWRAHDGRFGRLVVFDQEWHFIDMLREPYNWKDDRTLSDFASKYVPPPSDLNRTSEESQVVYRTRPPTHDPTERPPLVRRNATGPSYPEPRIVAPGLPSRQGGGSIGSYHRTREYIVPRSSGDGPTRWWSRLFSRR